MRVLFTTWAAPSHFFPMVPLAWAFRAAGHQVRIAAPPNCEPAVTAAGLTAVAVGPPPDVARTSTGGGLKSWHRQSSWPGDWPVAPERLDESQRGILRALGEKQFGIAEAMAPDLLAFAREWRPDLVVHDAGTYAGTLVAALLGVPAVSQMWGSAAVLRLEREGLRGEPLPGYTKLFERHGADPGFEPSLYLDPCPPLLTLPDPAPEVTRLPVRFVPYNGPGALPDWLRAEPATARVCITWGVTAGQFKPGSALPDVVWDVARRAADGGAEVVLTVTEEQRELLGPLPEGIRAVSMLPLSLLLPSCGAVVHQGGGGTSMTAAVCGVPQLVVPPRPEQMLTGARLAAVGAGRSIPFNELPAGPEAGALLAGELASLLDDPRHAAAARRVRRAAGAMPSPVEAVPLLAQLAQQGAETW